MPPPRFPEIEASDPDIRQSLDPFWTRLDETVHWCADRPVGLGVRECLRSDRLRPRSLQKGYFEAMQHVGVYRGLWARHPQTPRRDRLGLRAERDSGKLLVYFPDLELSDGAAEKESEGFFDVFNCPPWDTWVAFVNDAQPISRDHREYLVAWVPNTLVLTAARGITVNPEGSLLWLEQSRVAMARLLARVPAP
jgi:hypothetical protein